MNRFIKTSIVTFENVIRYFSETKLPNGRWIRDDNYTGSMSNIAQRISTYNDHDHCGGDLCKYPPTSNKFKPNDSLHQQS
tara:strand:- start:121 stop:360 length:240 start_codon:yes stop_codon:yes gene_type:complete